MTKQEEFDTACKDGDLKTVKRLINDSEVDPAAQDNQALFFILELLEKERDAVKLFLDDYMPTYYELRDDFYLPIIDAALQGDTDVVRLLLTSKRFNPNDGYYTAISEASSRGHVDVVKLLLADKRVDPTTLGNSAIQAASEKGHTEIVKLLLADKRVNPCDRDNRAIMEASKNGHVEIAELLEKAIKEREND